MKTLRELFGQGPHTWTQLHFARDSKGEWVDGLSDEAVCWCLLGGIERVTGNRDVIHTDLYKHTYKASYFEYGAAPSYANDKLIKSHEELMAFLNKYEL